MLTADGTAKSPLLERLRQANAADAVTGILMVEPHRKLLSALIAPYTAQLPPELKDVAGLPERVIAVTAAVNLNDKTLLKVALETDSEQKVAALDDLAFKGLNYGAAFFTSGCLRNAS